MDLTVKKIDILNIGLMVISLIAAFLLPFWLFLFSYAVLGPLHYLTEIGWLNKKRYFTTGRFDFLPLIIVAVVWAALYLFVELFIGLPNELKEDWLGANWFERVSSLQDKLPNLLLAALIGSVVMTFVKSWWIKLLALAAGFLMGVLFNYLDLTIYSHLIGALLPTLIHVFVFTGIFMLYGAVRSKSPYGFAGVGLLAICGICCFAIPSAATAADFGDAVDTYRASNFYSINAIILNFDQPQPWDYSNSSLFNEFGVQIQRFIAFAYTYHYLNWFSKTSIIGWHKISRLNIVASLIIWVGSVALYIYDYSIGLKVLLFLSILHVILEFPLNAHSFVGIFKGIFSKTR